MPNIEVCYDINRLKTIPPDTVVIIPRMLVKSIISEKDVSKKKTIFKNLKDRAPKELKNWFDVSEEEIIVHQFIKQLRILNSNIKIVEQNPIPAALIESFQKANLIPIIIV